jgi:hypothetical protein
MSTTEKMSENLEKYRERLEEIRSDWTRSDEAKRQDLQTAYTEARTTHARLEDEYRKGLNERLEKTHSAAFSVPKVGKDRPSTCSSTGTPTTVFQRLATLANSPTRSPAPA